MLTKIIKWVDRVIGGVGVAAFRTMPQQVVIHNSVNSLLIIRPGGIGDAVLLAPVINELKRCYPFAVITVLAEGRNAGVFELLPAVDRVWCYDRPFEFIKALHGRYDVVIDTEQWHRLSAIVARLVCVPMKIGFGTNERSRLFTHAVSYFHDDYEIESFARLLVPLGIQDFAHSVPFLTVPSDASLKAQGLLAGLGSQPFVALFPGASIAERRWGAERYCEVVAKLQCTGYAIVVVGGEKDCSAGDRIVAKGGLNLAGKTSLSETAAVLASSQLLISADSGVLHIAVGLGVPTVSLFGPGRDLKWAPQGDKHIVLNKQFACSPCTTFGITPPCPHNARCMQEIAVADVVSSALKLLSAGTLS